MFGGMETHTFPLAEEQKHKLDDLRTELRNQPIVNHAQNFIRSNPSWIWTGVALAGIVATCMVTRLFGRR
jgi:hypothetical protein